MEVAFKYYIDEHHYTPMISEFTDYITQLQLKEIKVQLLKYSCINLTNETSI